MREETRPCPRPQRRSPSSPQPSDVPGGGLAGIVRHVAMPGCHVLHSGRGTAGGGQDVCGRPGAGSLPPWSWVGASFYPGNKGIPSSAESWEFAGDRLHKCCCKSCSREGLVRTLGCRPGLLLSLGVRGATPGAGRAPGARGRPASPPLRGRRGCRRLHAQLPDRPQVLLPVGRVGLHAGAPWPGHILLDKPFFAPNSM